MKKCEYCSKEISYYDQYCSEDCHRLARKFYNTLEYKRKIFSVVNIVGILGLTVGLFWCVFQGDIGSIIAGSATLLLGILYYLLPFATPEMIRKHQIKKAIKNIKILGIAGIVVGAALLVWGIIKFL